MRFVSKRKIKILLYVVAALITIIVFVRCVVQFQITEEIKYYKRYFHEQKDGLQGIYNPLEIKQIPEETIDALYKARLLKDAKKKNPIDWSQYAYVNYVTNSEYLCNTLVMFQSLKEYDTKAKLLLLITRDLLDPTKTSNVPNIEKLLNQIKALDGDQVIIKHVDTIVKPEDISVWNESLTKLLVFNQTEFTRIIYLDNDAILQDDLDELFFLPDYVQFAATVTYWFLSEKEAQSTYNEIAKHEKRSTNLKTYTSKLEARIKSEKMIYNHLPSLPTSLIMNHKDIASEILSKTSSASPLFDFNKIRKERKIRFASNIMVLKPTTEVFERIMSEILPKALTKKEVYDMDLINDELYDLKTLVSKQFAIFRRLRTYFVPTVLVLPFGRYGILSGSLKNYKHYPVISNDVLGYKRLNPEGEMIIKSPQEILSSVKYVHFSDYPLGKPWNYHSIEQFECKETDISGNDVKLNTEMCAVWNEVYELYIRKSEICKL